VPVWVCGPDGAGRLDNVRLLAAGGAFTAVLREDGTVWGWGRNRYGQLGTGTTVDSLLPVPVRAPDGTGPLRTVTLLAAGFHHVLAVTADGAVWAWGRNRYGQLGDGSTADRTVPVRVRGPDGHGFLGDVTALGLGWDHTLALRRDGTVWAWGMGWNGLLGNGVAVDSPVPVQVRAGPDVAGPLAEVVAIAANWRHNLALKRDGTVWAWGRNQEGQLGTGTAVPAAWKNDPDLSLCELVPVQVRGIGGEGFLDRIAAIAAAAEHSAAVRADGSVLVWGSNNNEQLGLGPRGYPLMRSNPAPVPALNLQP